MRTLGAGLCPVRQAEGRALATGLLPGCPRSCVCHPQGSQLPGHADTHPPTADALPAAAVLRSLLPEQPRPVLDVSSGEHTPFGEAGCGCTSFWGCHDRKPQAGGLGDRNVQVLMVRRPESSESSAGGCYPTPHPVTAGDLWGLLAPSPISAPVSTRLLPVCQSVSKSPFFVRTPGLFD